MYSAPTRPDESWMASKLLYASHYFESQVDFITVSDAPAPTGKGATYLIILRRSKFDDLPSGGLFNIRGKAVKKLRDALKTTLASTRAEMSAAYAEHAQATVPAPLRKFARTLPVPSPSCSSLPMFASRSRVVGANTRMSRSRTPRARCPRCLAWRPPPHTAKSAMDDMAERMAGVLGIPHTRLGLGNELAPARHRHTMDGTSCAAAGRSWCTASRTPSTTASSARAASDQFGSINWGMLMAMHSLWGGMLHLHGMLSAEPATIGSEGYPLLLQSGESYHGEPLHDRQHPHDLFMELAAMYEHPIAQNLALSLYVAPVGEPAFGPVAFPHRPSAASDPLAPLGHHWQDATHITFGVLTLGMFSRTWKVEGSIFNGREPDEHRTNFETRTLDSYAARVFYNPNVSWSYSASMAYLASPEVLHPDESLHRYSASIMNTRLFGSRGAVEQLTHLRRERGQRCAAREQRARRDRFRASMA